MKHHDTFFHPTSKELIKYGPIQQAKEKTLGINDQHFKTP
jgi:hypothetical protein